MDVTAEELEALMTAFAGDDPAIKDMLKMFTTGTTVDASGMGGFGGMGDLGGLGDMFGGAGDLGGFGDLGEMFGGLGDLGGFGDLMGGMGGMFNMPTSFTMKPELQFFALDGGTEAKGNAAAMVMKMTLPMKVGSSMLCSFMPQYFGQMGFTIVDSVCGLQHNGYDGGFFDTDAKFGEKAFRQHMFFLLDGADMWMLSLAVRPMPGRSTSQPSGVSPAPSGSAIRR